MKWIGQHIFDLISKFRNDVYLESISSGTIASGGNLGLDSNNKIVKQSDTGITDLHGAGVDGSANQLLTDDGDGTVTSEQYLTFSIDSDVESTLSLLSSEDTGDLFKIATTTNGATTLTTVDDNAAAAHITLQPDGEIINISVNGVTKFQKSGNTDDQAFLTIGDNGDATLSTIDAAGDAAHIELAADGDITLDAVGEIKLEPGTGAGILLDGTVNVDAGVVTGATSITSTSFTAGTTVVTDDSIVMTPSTDDTFTIAAAANGATTLTTLDTAATAC